MKRIIFALILFPLTSFNSLFAQKMSLQQCREMALAHDESLKSADIAVRQAALDRKNAFATYLPQLDGNVNAIYREDIGIQGVELQFRGALIGGLTLTQPIYQGGKIVAANQLAKIKEKSSREQLRKTQADLIYDVDNAYYTLIGLDARVKMLEGYQRQMEKLISDVKLSVKNGLAVENDLMRVENEQSETKLLLTQAKNGRKICNLALASLIGSDMMQEIIPTDTFSVNGPFPKTAAVQGASIASRPELALLQQRVNVAEQQVKIARAGYLPSLGLQIGYSGFTNLKLKGQLMTTTGDVLNLDQNLHKSSPMAVLALKVPIFHWGSEFRKTKSAKLDVESARLDMEKKSRQMNVEMQQAILNLSTSDEMVETARTGLRQADENLRIVRQRYSVQLATMTDLLDAENRWQKSYASLIDALTQQRIYQTEYLRVTGQLS